MAEKKDRTKGDKRVPLGKEYENKDFKQTNLKSELDINSTKHKQTVEGVEVQNKNTARRAQ